MNAFLSTGGVSDWFSPSNILLGLNNPNFNRKRLPFWSYVYIYSGTDNTMESRSTPSIALYEINGHDGYNFMSLESGLKVHARRWEHLPISDDVINRVNTITKNQPIMPHKQPIFVWAPGIVINTDDAYFSDENDDDNDDVNNRADHQEIILHEVNHGIVVSDDDTNDETIIHDDLSIEENTDDRHRRTPIPKKPL